MYYKSVLTFLKIAAEVSAFSLSLFKKLITKFKSSKLVRELELNQLMRT